MSIYQDYLDLKAQEADIKKKIEQCQVGLYLAHQERLDAIDTGSMTEENDGFKITIIKKETVSVDQKLASVVDLGFRKKYELDKTAYKKLSKADQKRVDECLTTKPAKPSFKVERIEE